jgi:gp32 DNA binding protein like
MSQGALSIADRLALRRGEIAQNKSKGLRPFKLPAGKTLFRIIPQKGYPDNIAPGTFGVERRFGMTYLKSFDGKNVGSIGDKEITYGQDDPVRNMIFEAMRQAPNDDVKKHYRDMLANPRIVFCALILNHPTLQKPDEPVLIEISETAFDEGILAQAQVWGDTGVDVFDPTSGHVFQVEKSGTGMETSYTWAVTPQKAPIGQAILDKTIDLDGWVQSLFEGKEQRVFEALAKLNASAGLTIAAPQTVAQIAPPAQAQLPGPAPTPQVVTHAIEPDEAVYEEVAEETAAPAAAPAEAPATPAAPPAATPPAAEEDGDLASILASLN